MKLIINVPIDEVEKYEKQLIKINKKADKWNIKGVNYTKLNQIIETKEIYVPELQEYIKMSREVIPFNIEYEDIKLGDYEIIGYIDQSKIKQIYSIKGDLNLHERYEETPKTLCEHCNTKRARNKQYIISNREGKELVVGSSCVKDFTGVNPQGHFKFINDIKNLNTSFSGNYQETYDIEKILELSIKSVEERGYHNKYSDQETTLEDVLVRLNKA